MAITVILVGAALLTLAARSAPAAVVPRIQFADAASASAWVHLAARDDLVLVPMVGATAAARLDRLAWISAQRRSAAVFLQVELARPPRDAAMRLTLGAEHEGWVIRAEGAATVPDAIAAIAVALGAREILVGSSAQPAGRRGRREVGAAVADRLDALRVARIAEQRRAAARFAQERRRMERDVLRGLITAGSDRAGRIAALFDAERARFPRGDRRRPLPSVTWVA